MKRKCIFNILLVLLLMSCGSASLTSRAKKLQIGMTKREVVDVLGNNYIAIGGRETPDGVIESFVFMSAIDYPYMTHFLNARLVEFYMDKHYFDDNHQHKGRRIQNTDN